MAGKMGAKRNLIQNGLLCAMLLGAVVENVSISGLIKGRTGTVFHHGRCLFDFKLSRRQGCGQSAFAHGRRFNWRVKGSRFQLPRFHSTFFILNSASGFPARSVHPRFSG
jgi:hypothetical protein